MLLLLTVGTSMAQAPAGLLESVNVDSADAGGANQPGAGQAPPDPLPPDAARFDALEFLVTGNTVLPQIEIEDAVYQFLGPGRTIDDMEGARAALEQRYVERGYAGVGVNLPEQRVDPATGVVRLDVVEQRIGRLRVEGSRYYSLERIEAAAPSVAEGKVPHLPSIQRDAGRLASLPGRQVTPSLKAGKEPFTLDADLTVEDEKPWRARTELNNYKSADTEPLRLSADVGYDNLFQRGHSLSLGYVVAPQRPDDVQVFSGSYTIRRPEHPESLRLYGFKSNSEVAAVGGSQVVGQGYQVGARAIVPLPEAGGFEHSLTGGVDLKHFRDREDTFGAVTRTPVSYFPLSLEYSATRRGERSTSVARLGAVANAGLGGSSDEFGGDGDQGGKRAGSSRNFAYLTYGLDHLQQLPRSFELVARLSGQVTKDALINNEQFAAGGINTARGYLEAEQLGDSAIAASLQLESPDLAQYLKVQGKEPVDALKLYGFIEGAHLWLVETLPEEEETFDLASVGIGTRISALDYLDAAFDIAVPLRQTSRTDRGDVRFLFSLGAGL